MKNSQGSEAPARLGPAPAAPRPGRTMSESRAALLETLRTQAEPTTLDDLARATGLHENTVREHLDALGEDGWVVRHRAAPSGRGRPAWLYEAVDVDPTAGSEYAGLAGALAASIHHRSPSPREDALAAGWSWGRDLAGQREAGPQPTAAAARREAVDLLDDLGFAPDADRTASTVRLTRCPLLEAAHRYPDVVCAVHLGLAQGALEEYGAEPDRVRLTPFAEPGACVLQLAARTS